MLIFPVMLAASWNIDRIVSPGSPAGIISDSRVLTYTSIYDFRASAAIMPFNRNAQQIKGNDSIYAVLFDNTVTIMTASADTYRIIGDINHSRPVSDYSVAGNILILNEGFSTHFYHIGADIDTLSYTGYLGSIEHSAAKDSFIVTVNRNNVINLFVLSDDSVKLVDSRNSDYVSALFFNHYGLLCAHTKSDYFNYYSVSEAGIETKGSIFDSKVYSNIIRLDSVYIFSMDSISYLCHYIDTFTHAVSDSIEIGNIDDGDYFNDTLYIMSGGAVYSIDPDFAIADSVHISCMVNALGNAYEGFNILCGSTLYKYSETLDSVILINSNNDIYDIKDNVMLCSDSAVLIQKDTIELIRTGSIPGATSIFNDSVIYSTVNGEIRAADSGSDSFLFSTNYPVYDMEHSGDYIFCSGYDGIAMTDSSGNVYRKKHLNTFISRVFTNGGNISALSADGSVFILDSLLEIQAIDYCMPPVSVVKTDSCMYSVSDSIYIINDSVSRFDFSQGDYTDIRYFAVSDSTAMVALANDVLLLLRNSPAMIKFIPEKQYERTAGSSELQVFDISGRILPAPSRPGIYFFRQGGTTQKMLIIK